MTKNSKERQNFLSAAYDAIGSVSYRRKDRDLLELFLVTLISVTRVFSVLIYLDNSPMIGGINISLPFIPGNMFSLLLWFGLLGIFGVSTFTVFWKIQEDGGLEKNPTSEISATWIPWFWALYRITMLLMWLPFIS